jgi:hypothetical protein
VHTAGEMRELVGWDPGFRGFALSEVQDCSGCLLLMSSLNQEMVERPDAAMVRHRTCTLSFLLQLIHGSSDGPTEQGHGDEKVLTSVWVR